MNTFNTRLAALVAVLATTSLPVLASSTASSAAGGSSASVGSVSDSLGTSSHSSTNVQKIDEGDYKVIEVATVTERPGIVRMTLQPVADSSADNVFFLYVPQQVLSQSHMAAGQVVSARDRPYGTQFAKADTGTAFFLVLQDSWYRELQSNVVTL